jgi:hypothetical protein
MACDVLIERQHTASLWSVTQLPPAPCASAPCMHIATCVVPLAALPPRARAAATAFRGRRGGADGHGRGRCAQPSGRQLPVGRRAVPGRVTRARGRRTPYAPCQVCWHWQHSAVRTTAAEPSPVAVQPTPLSRTVRLTSCTLLLGRSTYVRQKRHATGAPWTPVTRPSVMRAYRLRKPTCTSAGARHVACSSGPVYFATCTYLYA